MKITVGIPYWESDPQKRQVLLDCIGSLEGWNQLIVANGKAPSLAGAVNDLLAQGFAGGADYVIISNDDIVLLSDTLEDLCKPDKVTSPLVDGGIYKIFHGHIFCIPRAIYEKHGGMDDNYIVYWWDQDYAKNLVELNNPPIIVPIVNVAHKHPARTLKSTPSELEKQDREYFRNKWGMLYFDPVTGRELPE